MKVAVFGDSFVLFSGSEPLNGDHWLQRLERRQNCKLHIKYAQGGSGPLNAIANFYKFQNTQESKEYDTFIFAWSQPSRLFHKHVEDINFFSAQNPTARQHPNLNKVYESAYQYHNNFYIGQYEDMKLVGVLQWFDKVLRKDFSDKKIIHFHSFSAGVEFATGEPRLIENQYLYHRFASGITMYPSLMWFSENDPKFNAKEQYKDQRNGHLSNPDHEIVYNKLIEAMDLNAGDECLLTESKPKYIIDKYVDVWKAIDINNYTPSPSIP